MASNSVLLLLSGGIDSIVCAALAHSQGRLRACLSFNYGQPAASCELSMAQYWCATHQVQWIGLMLPYITASSMRTGVGMVGPRVVPARNAIFTACAANFAVSLQAPIVWYGATADDRADYADCRREWIDAMSEVLHLSSGITLEAPLVDKTQAEVVTLGNTLGVEWNRTWSCYQPKNGYLPCRRCNACQRRLAVLGTDDAPELVRTDEAERWRHGLGHSVTTP